MDYDDYWNRTESTNFKAHFIRQYHRVLPNAIIKSAFLSDYIEIRQALASSLYGISGVKQSRTEMADLFETLLEDESYMTIENALLKLWANFPEKRTVYLSKTQNIVGLPNKNVRLLWLTLALLTPGYNLGQQQAYYNELNGYTSTDNHFEVRQLAFQYLSQIQAMSDETLVNLIKASDHHVWQFKKSSRNLLKELSENIELKERLLSISNSLSTEEQSTLKKLLKQ